MMVSDGQMITCIDSIEQRMRTAATAGVVRGSGGQGVRALTKALCGVHVRCMGSSANRARTAAGATGGLAVRAEPSQLMRWADLVAPLCLC